MFHSGQVVAGHVCCLGKIKPRGEGGNLVGYVVRGGLAGVGNESIGEEDRPIYFRFSCRRRLELAADFFCFLGVGAFFLGVCVAALVSLSDTAALARRGLEAEAVCFILVAGVFVFGVRAGAPRPEFFALASVVFPGLAVRDIFWLSWLRLERSCFIFASTRWLMRASMVSDETEGSFSSWRAAAAVAFSILDFST